MSKASVWSVRWGAVLAPLGVLAVGACLRLFRLGAESLWFDEAYTVTFAGSDLNMLSPLNRYGFAFPDRNAYNVMLHFWLSLGRSELAIRSLSVLIGVATIAVLYLFARRLFGERTALWAAGLLAVSPFHIWYSREVRMYVLAGLASLLAAWLLYEAWRHGGVWRWLGYGLAAALASYTHPFALLVVAAGNLWVLVSAIRERRSVIVWLLVNAAVGLASVPWLVQVSAQQGTGWWTWIADKYGNPTLGALLRAARELTFGAIREGPGWVYWLGFAAMAAAVLRAVLPPRKGASGDWWRDGGDMWTLVVILAVVPVLCAFGLSQVKPVFVLRYMVPFAAPLCMLAGRGLAELRPGWLRVAPAALIVGASALALSGVYNGQFKEDWRAAAATLDAQVQAGETVFVVDEDSLVPMQFYSRADAHWTPVWRGRTDAGELAAIIDPAIADGRRFWLVVSHCDNSALESALKQRRPASDETDVLGIRLLRFDAARGGG